MTVEYSEKAYKDLQFWLKSGNKPIQKKILILIENIKKAPFDGIGKPEALKYSLLGKWSRHINEEHRIVYSLKEEANIILIHSLKGHY